MERHSRPTRGCALTRATAKARAARVGDVRYELEIRIDSDRKALLSKFESALWNLSQNARTEDWRKLYFDGYVRVAQTRSAQKRLAALARTKPSEFMESFTENLVPANCLPEDSFNIEFSIGKYPNLPPVAMKGLRVARHENDRCVAVRELAEQRP